MPGSRRLCSLAFAALVIAAACGPSGGDTGRPDAAPAWDAAAPDGAIADAAPASDAPAPDGAPASDASAPDGALADGAPADAEPNGPTPLRLVSANLTSGNFQRYEAPGIRILQALRPDVALLQELNHGDNQPATLRAFVDTTFGPGYHVFRETTTGIPNGVVSRYPILEAGTIDDPTLTDRELVWARIDVPGAKDLWAVSVHLKASSGDRSTRQEAAAALVAGVRARIPEADYLVVGGDLNTQDLDEPCLVELTQIVGLGASPPVDQLGDADTNAGRSRRYDWLLLDAELEPLVVPVVLGESRFEHGLVFDSRVYTPLAEVPPVLVDDSAANGMQHMAVVKDLILP